MIGSRYLIRHDAIVVPDFHFFMKSPGVGRGLFDFLTSALREENFCRGNLPKQRDERLSTSDPESPWWISRFVSFHERVGFYLACTDGLDAEQLAGHKQLGGHLSTADIKRSSDLFEFLICKPVKIDSEFLDRIKFELESYLSYWDKDVIMAENGAPGDLPYFAPWDTVSYEGIIDFSYLRDTLGYAISGFLRLAESGLIDGAILEPFLARLGAIDERYRRVLGDRRDVRTPERLEGFDFYPAEFWWHHPV